MRQTGAGRAGRRGLLPETRASQPLWPASGLPACLRACVCPCVSQPQPAGGALATWDLIAPEAGGVLPVILKQRRLCCSA